MSEARTHRFKWKIFGAAMVSIVLGYILLALADTTFSAVLLVVGYCVLVPLAFL